MTSSSRLIATVVWIGVAVALASLRGGAQAPEEADLLARSRAAYGALRSYGDTGTVVVDAQSPGAPPLVERFRFRTAYRSPRHFSFDFSADAPGNGERLVIWCDGGDFQSWWSATGVHEVWSNGRGVSAFGTAVFPTRGAAAQIPPWLFPAAEMHGPLVDLIPDRRHGVESVDGRRSHKLTGRSGGHFGAARPVTVWIDAETLLVRRIVEDTPDGTPAGTTERVTTTFTPQANPDLAASRFTFSVPAGRR